MFIQQNLAPPILLLFLPAGNQLEKLHNMHCDSETISYTTEFDDRKLAITVLIEF